MEVEIGEEVEVFVALYCEAVPRRLSTEFYKDTTACNAGI